MTATFPGGGLSELVSCITQHSQDWRLGAVILIPVLGHLLSGEDGHHTQSSEQQSSQHASPAHQSQPKHKVGETSIEVRPTGNISHYLMHTSSSSGSSNLDFRLKQVIKKILNNSIYIKVCLITFSEVLQQSLPRKTRALWNDRL